MSTEAKWLGAAFAVLLLAGGALAYRSKLKRDAAQQTAQAALAVDEAAAANEAAQHSPEELVRTVMAAPVEAQSPLERPKDVPVVTRLPVPPDWLSGAAGYETALAAQKESGASLLVYFFVDWCRYCRELDQDGWSNGAVRTELSKLVKVRINPEDGAPERALANQFTVNSYPRVYVVGAGTGKRHRIAITRDDTAGYLVKQFQELGSMEKSHQLDKGDSLAEEPTTAIDYQLRGQARQKAGRPDLAAQDFERATQLDPANLLVKDQLGYLHLQQGKFREAAEAYSAIIAAEPGYKQGRAYLQRGAARIRLGEGEQAKDDARQACEQGNAQGCAMVR